MTATQEKRMSALDLWLERVDAYEKWSVPMPDKGGTITAYLINCNLVLAIRYAESMTCGWELLIPASNKNMTADTLDGAARFCGVDGCRGLPGCD